MRWIRARIRHLRVPASVRRCLCVCLEILESPHVPIPRRRQRVYWGLVTNADGFVDQCRVPHADGGDAGD